MQSDMGRPLNATQRLQALRTVADYVFLPQEARARWGRESIERVQQALHDLELRGPDGRVIDVTVDGVVGRQTVEAVRAYGSDLLRQIELLPEFQEMEISSYIAIATERLAHGGQLAQVNYDLRGLGAVYYNPYFGGISEQSRISAQFGSYYGGGILGRAEGGLNGNVTWYMSSRGLDGPGDVVGAVAPTFSGIVADLERTYGGIRARPRAEFSMVSGMRNPDQLLGFTGSNNPGFFQGDTVVESDVTPSLFASRYDFNMPLVYNFAPQVEVDEHGRLFCPPPDPIEEEPEWHERLLADASVWTIRTGMEFLGMRVVVENAEGESVTVLGRDEPRFGVDLRPFPMGLISGEIRLSPSRTPGIDEARVEQYMSIAGFRFNSGALIDGGVSSTGQILTWGWGHIERGAAEAWNDFTSILYIAGSEPEELQHNIDTYGSMLAPQVLDRLPLVEPITVENIELRAEGVRDSISSTLGAPQMQMAIGWRPMGRIIYNGVPYEDGIPDEVLPSGTVTNIYAVYVRHDNGEVEILDPSFRRNEPVAGIDDMLAALGQLPGYLVAPAQNAADRRWQEYARGNTFGQMLTGVITAIPTGGAGAFVAVPMNGLRVLSAAEFGSSMLMVGNMAAELYFEHTSLNQMADLYLGDQEITLGGMRGILDQGLSRYSHTGRPFTAQYYVAPLGENASEAAIEDRFEQVLSGRVESVGRRDNSPWDEQNVSARSIANIRDFVRQNPRIEERFLELSAQLMTNPESLSQQDLLRLRMGYNFMAAARSFEPIDFDMDNQNLDAYRADTYATLYEYYLSLHLERQYQVTGEVRMPPEGRIIPDAIVPEITARRAEVAAEIRTGAQQGQVSLSQQVQTELDPTISVQPAP